MTSLVAEWPDPDLIRLDVDDGSALAWVLRGLHDREPVSRFANIATLEESMTDRAEDADGRRALDLIATEVVGVSTADDVHDDERLRFGDIREALAGAGMLLPEDTRCRSCDHLPDMHREDGCWFTVATGAEGRDLVCPCLVSVTQYAAELLREATDG